MGYAVYFSLTLSIYSHKDVFRKRYVSFADLVLQPYLLNAPRQPRFGPLQLDFETVTQSDQGIHCLPVYHNKDARLICVEMLVSMLKV